MAVQINLDSIKNISKYKVVRDVKLLLKFFFDLAIFTLNWTYRKTFGSSLKKITNEVVLITGGGGALGREIALSLAKNATGKVQFVLWDRSSEENKKTADMVKDLGAHAFCYQVDVTDRKQVEAFGDKVSRTVGPVTMLFHCEELYSSDRITEFEGKIVEETIRLNVLALFWTIQKFLPKMIASEKGHIVAVNSAPGIGATAFSTPFVTSKYAIEGLMRSLQTELHFSDPNGFVKLSIAYPGYVGTPEDSLTNKQELKTVFGYERTALQSNFEKAAKAIVDGVRRDKFYIRGSRLESFIDFLRNNLPNDFQRILASNLITEFNVGGKHLYMSETNELAATD